MVSCSLFLGRKNIHCYRKSRCTLRGVIFNNEQLLSDWADTVAGFPALALHKSDYERPFHYVFERNDNGFLDIELASLAPDGRATNITLTPWPDPIVAGSGLPVIAAAEMGDSLSVRRPVDIVAWSTGSGIRVRAIRCDASLADTTFATDLFIPGDSTMRFPTIWIDTSYRADGGGYDHIKFWLAWQYDQLDPMRDINPMHKFTDIYCTERQIKYGKFKPLTIDTVWNENIGNTNISKLTSSFGGHANNEMDARHPCISGCRINDSTTVVDVAYENIEQISESGPVPSSIHQGIAIAHWRSAKPWARTFFAATPDTISDRYWYPSIEVSRYHMDSSTFTSSTRDNFYSFSHERMNGQWTMNWALDSSTSRVLLYYWYYLNTRHPQVSVVPQSTDRYMASMETCPAGEPFWNVLGGPGLYKRTVTDSLFTYRSVTEVDSSGSVALSAAIGELTVDDGSLEQPIEIAERPDQISIDSAHTAGYVMSTETFSLPSQGTVSYYTWVGPVANDRSKADSLFKADIGKATFYLDFYDTTGTFVARLDSLELKDTITAIAGVTRTITIDRPNSKRGYLSLHRIASNLRTDSSIWQDMLLTQRLSDAGSNKLARRVQIQADLGLEAHPNPLKDHTEIRFKIPERGRVTLEVFNVLGERVSTITEREFHAGEQRLIWNSGYLPEGSYLMQMHYGNSFQKLRVVIQK